MLMCIRFSVWVKLVYSFQLSSVLVHFSQSLSDQLAPVIRSQLELFGFFINLLEPKILCLVSKVFVFHYCEDD